MRSYSSSSSICVCPIAASARREALISTGSVTSWNTVESANAMMPTLMSAPSEAAGANQTKHAKKQEKTKYEQLVQELRAALPQWYADGQRKLPGEQALAVTTEKPCAERQACTSLRSEGKM